MATHLYWRLYITASQGNPTGKTYWHTLAEIEMRATPGGADQCSGGTASAHDYYSGSYTPAKAFDNSTSTFWGSWPGSNLGDGWIKYQFASGVNVQEVAITARNDPSLTDYAPKSFSLQWSDNNSSWTTIASWNNVAAWSQGETRLFRPPLVVTSQSAHPYGIKVEMALGHPYDNARAQTQLNCRYSDWSDAFSAQLVIPYGNWHSTAQCMAPYANWTIASQSILPYGDAMPTAMAVFSYENCTLVVSQVEQNYLASVLEQTLTCPLFFTSSSQWSLPWSIHSPADQQAAMTWSQTLAVNSQLSELWHVLDHDPVVSQLAAPWDVTREQSPILAIRQLFLWHQGVSL